MSVSETRASLPDVLDRVAKGDEVVITRHGVPVAVIVRPDVLRVRRADAAFGGAERLRDLLERGRQIDLGRAPTIDPERAEELIAEVADSRRRR